MRGLREIMITFLVLIRPDGKLREVRNLNLAGDHRIPNVTWVGRLTLMSVRTICDPEI